MVALPCASKRAMTAVMHLLSAVLILQEGCSAFVSGGTNSRPSSKKTTTLHTAGMDIGITADKNVNFDDWIADAPEEVIGWKALDSVGPTSGSSTTKIPDYVRGTLIRVGGGMWSTGGSNGRDGGVDHPNDDNDGDGGEGELFSHVFDGMAKIHAYRIRDGSNSVSSIDDNNIDDSKRNPNHSTIVEHQSRFLRGSWYEKFQETSQKGKLPISIGTGPILDDNLRKSQEQLQEEEEEQSLRIEPKTGMWRVAQAIWNSITIFDNTPVNIWDFDPMRRRQQRQTSVTALTDAPPRTSILLDTMETSSTTTINSFPKGAKGYELLTTAHPLYSLTSDDTYNVATELGPGGVSVNLVREDGGTGSRSVVGSFTIDDGVPYMHSFGLSSRYAVVVLQPLRVDPNPARIIELGFLRAMTDVDQTRVVVLDLESGRVVLDESMEEKVYFYHVVSTAEEGEDGDEGDVDVVSLRLCAYQTPDQLTGEHQFMRMEQARRGKAWRNKLHKGGKFCDILCNLKDQTVHVRWNKHIEQGFELPITRYSRLYNTKSNVDETFSRKKHPRYVYSFGAFALGSSDYDSWGLFKFDLQHNVVAAHYQQDSVYMSEPVFVADPKGSNEDDGVLLLQAYFGHERETKLLVLDALTMQVLEEVGTGFRSPMDFHGAWIPASSALS